MLHSTDCDKTYILFFPLHNNTAMSFAGTVNFTHNENWKIHVCAPGYSNRTVRELTLELKTRAFDKDRQNSVRNRTAAV